MFGEGASGSLGGIHFHWDGVVLGFVFQGRLPLLFSVFPVFGGPSES